MSQQRSRGSTQVTLDPHLMNASVGLLGQAQNLYYRPEALPSLYTGINQIRQAGLAGVAGTALQGGATGPALAEYNKTLGGGYLDAGSNPYLQDIVRRATSEAMAGPLSGYNAAGRFGSGLMDQAVADAGTATAARLYGGQYEAERQRMAEMAGMAPMFNALSYDPSMQLMNVGSALEQDTQNQQAEQVRQYMWPYMQQQILQEQLAGSPLMGANRTTSRGSQMNIDWGSMIGGILSPSAPGMGGK